MNGELPIGYKRIYNTELDVYDAAIERIKYIFDTFPRVYISFSGGKDSGVLLNLCIDYVRKHCPDRKIGVMVMDNECNFTYSLEFMLDMLDSNRDVLDIYWCCLPLTLPCTVSAYHLDWQCWGENDKERWVQPQPDRDYVVNVENMPFDFLREDMLDKDFYDNFSEWYSQGELCANLIGIRTDESLNRFRTIMNARKETIDGRMWTRKNGTTAYNCYPIYDWKTDDVWTANARFEWNYNKLYDVFYRAGLPVGTMRVASPFMSESKSSLNMYRVINPDIWARLCARVHGANFVATYGKQLSYRHINLPEGHTWKSFTKFLIETLPQESSVNFKSRFIQSIKFWGRVGRGLPAQIIDGLREAGIKIHINGLTRHGRQNLERVIIKVPPDHLDMLPKENGSVTSWKRFAITILKNDHTCKYMGLAPTKAQAERQKAITKKYSKVGK